MNGKRQGVSKSPPAPPRSRIPEPGSYFLLSFFAVRSYVYFDRCVYSQQAKPQ
ncbi:hypothetical protein K443DRAFT_682570 [Laccaria amethystina LaAM-08-1]|uniref:Uncharacterized protein n=1 Tax=Laccaria amethystina LaAM-08-1 TaxID=1095629 RepID=A0A0C9WKA4_9AGAR|nr:hypothetical protein K443DRAFT_682570 [Laccaria amethystina LaAM-08-1]